MTEKDVIQIDHMEHESPTHAIVKAISALENRPVTELPSLYETIDTEALNRLLQHSKRTDTRVRVKLQVNDYTVHAQSDGTVMVVDGSVDPRSGR